ncbi:anti-sigma factor [Phenylobacterium sp. LjRoot219]|uniref:anti-sigma factor family protein n=1 Tax=Phenylobacterium sp. LjRoot219 TaxID=3342283 RepID=UPI003ED14570
MDRDERLIAYVDGELTAVDRVAFEAELIADPLLQHEVERQRELRRRLSAAFAPVLDEPVPLQLALAAHAANTPSRRAPARRWAAVAAGVALGVLVGRITLPQRAPLVMERGVLVAHGELADALDRQLAAERGPIQVGLSFKSQDGRYCRTFQSTPDGLAGLACRAPKSWTAQAVTAWAPAAGTAYRTAGSETPAPVLAAVDNLISGEPLDAAAERTARDAGWRP